jgi:hypothetical protein
LRKVVLSYHNLFLFTFTIERINIGISRGELSRRDEFVVLKAANYGGDTVDYHHDHLGEGRDRIE